MRLRLSKAVRDDLRAWRRPTPFPRARHLTPIVTGPPPRVRAAARGKTQNKKPTMKNQDLLDRFEGEAARFTQLAKEHALRAVNRILDRPAETRFLGEVDLRIIRDHMIRAETFKEAAHLVATHHA